VQKQRTPQETRPWRWIGCWFRYCRRCSNSYYRPGSGSRHALCLFVCFRWGGSRAGVGGHSCSQERLVSVMW